MVSDNFLQDMMALYGVSAEFWESYRGVTEGLRLQGCLSLSETTCSLNPSRKVIQRLLKPSESSCIALDSH